MARPIDGHVAARGLIGALLAVATPLLAGCGSNSARTTPIAGCRPIRSAAFATASRSAIAAARLSLRIATLIGAILLLGQAQDGKPSG